MPEALVEVLVWMLRTSGHGQPHLPFQRPDHLQERVPGCRSMVAKFGSPMLGSEGWQISVVYARKGLKRWRGSGINLWVGHVCLSDLKYNLLTCLCLPWATDI